MANRADQKAQHARNVERAERGARLGRGGLSATLTEIAAEQGQAAADAARRDIARHRT